MKPDFAPQSQSQSRDSGHNTMNVSGVGLDIGPQ